MSTGDPTCSPGSGEGARRSRRGGIAFSGRDTERRRIEATLRACNRAATHASAVAFNRGVRDRNGPQKEVYADLRAAFGLSAQPVVRAVKKVVDAYATLRATLRAGNPGPSTSRRCRRALGTPIVLRPEAAQPFDDRCLSWQHDARTVSLWTVDGRTKGTRCAGAADAVAGVNVRDRARSVWVCVTMPVPPPV